MEMFAVPNDDTPRLRFDIQQTPAKPHGFDFDT